MFATCMCEGSALGPACACFNIWEMNLVWREKEGSRIKGVQMYNLRSLVSIRRIDRMPNAQVKGSCGAKRGWVKDSPVVSPY